MKRFIILGMGFVSPRHLDAIKAIGGVLVAYHDISDVVGHVDSRFIDAKYYREFIHFDCFVNRQQRSNEPIDYAVVLLPNHLHNPACQWAMHHGMDVICEKPLVIHERNLDDLAEVEEQTGRKVSVILQCRLHPEVEKAEFKKPAFVKIDYQSSRGPWYHNGSWKSDPDKSGGLMMNIGIHMMDLCDALFGDWIQFEINRHCVDEIAGSAMYEHAEVEFRLSVKPGGISRVFNISGADINLTNGFNDLHTRMYERILADEGFGIEHIRMSTRLVEGIRDACN